MELSDKFYNIKYDLKPEFFSNLKELMGKYPLHLHFEYGRHMLIICKGSSAYLSPPNNCEWYVFGVSHWEDDYLKSIGLHSNFLLDADVDKILKHVANATLATDYSHPSNDLSIFNTSRGDYNWSIIVDTLVERDKLTVRHKDLDRLGDLRMITFVNRRRIKEVSIEQLYSGHQLTSKLLTLLHEPRSTKRMCFML